MQPTGFNAGVISGVQCYREAWEMIQGRYWTVFAIVLVGMLVGGAVPLILMGPMMAGIYLCLFDVYEGRPAIFERLFKGFEFFVPSLAITLFIMVPVLIMAVLVYVPLAVAALAGPRMDENELMMFLGGTLIVELIFMVIMVCLHTLLLFAFPLLVDRRLSAMAAVKLSARAVWANLGGVAGLMAVGIVVTLAGLLLICVGVYLTLPLLMAANLVAYRKVFPGTLNEGFAAPPPPTAYQGL